MNFKLFTDLIDALSKVFGGLKAIVNLPQAERQKYRQTMDEVYLILNTTLNMVILRLGDILNKKDDQDFLDEVSKLDNDSKWLEAERAFGLCPNLRAAIHEAETLPGKLPGKLSIRDWNALLQQMRSVLPKERELAYYIGKQFRNLANSARGSAQTTDKIREQVTEFREALYEERQQLMEQERALHAWV